MIPLGPSDIAVARERIAGAISTTPLKRSQILSQLTGTDLYLKFENQQFTASFKERGALNRLLMLSDEERKDGVIAASAGNHAQALAYHGSRLGVPITIVMPRFTPLTKVENTRVFGVDVVLEGKNFAEASQVAVQFAEERGLHLVHAFDDPQVIAGQGTLGLELFEQEPDIGTIIVPVGGGGLISGIAIAAKSINPHVRIVGVQSRAFDGAYATFTGRIPSQSPPVTIAEGIAVKEPGQITTEVMKHYVDDMVRVNEEEIEAAVFTLLEVEKTVTEGAGAAALAALRSNPDIATGNTVVILSGGNIDMLTLSAVVQRGLVRSQRLFKMHVAIPDVPGSLATLTAKLGEMQANIIEISHKRAMDHSSFGATVVELVLQMRDAKQANLVVETLSDGGYTASLQSI